jgi:hypothetical protein
MYFDTHARPSLPAVTVPSLPVATHSPLLSVATDVAHDVVGVVAATHRSKASLADQCHAPVGPTTTQLPLPSVATLAALQASGGVSVVVSIWVHVSPESVDNHAPAGPTTTHVAVGLAPSVATPFNEAVVGCVVAAVHVVAGFVLRYAGLELMPTLTQLPDPSVATFRPSYPKGGAGADAVHVMPSGDVHAEPTPTATHRLLPSVATPAAELPMPVGPIHVTPSVVEDHASPLPNKAPTAATGPSGSVAAAAAGVVTMFGATQAVPAAAVARPVRTRKRRRSGDRGEGACAASRDAPEVVSLCIGPQTGSTAYPSAWRRYPSGTTERRTAALITSSRGRVRSRSADTHRVRRWRWRMI